jgi:hypothetical protein
MQVKNKVNEQANESKKAFARIETKSFIVVVLLLGALLAISGILSYVIPQGSFLRDECGTIIEGSYTRNEEQGGIPVWRSKHNSMTENLAQAAKDAKEFHLCITPEGTRSANPDWKKGFYYIALNAQIPILLYGLDYKRKLIECTKSIIPNGDIENQMREIKIYFKDFKGKKPEKFTIGDIK